MVSYSLTVDNREDLQWLQITTQLQRYLFNAKIQLEDIHLFFLRIIIRVWLARGKSFPFRRAEEEFTIFNSEHLSSYAKLAVRKNRSGTLTILWSARDVQGNFNYSLKSFTDQQIQDIICNGHFQE